MLEGECWDTEVSEKVGIAVDGSFRSIEGCELTDEGTGNANATTAGSTAQAVCTHLSSSSGLCCRVHASLTVSLRPISTAFIFVRRLKLMAGTVPTDASELYRGELPKQH